VVVIDNCELKFHRRFPLSGIVVGINTVTPPTWHPFINGRWARLDFLLFSSLSPMRDLLLRAKHLFIAAMS
jgi:hypothetical protein